MAAMVADEQAGDHHGDRAGQVQGVRQGIAAGDQRQGDHDLHLIVVDLFQHPVGEHARGQAQQQPAEGLLDEQ
jgi:hypothetical protein